MHNDSIFLTDWALMLGNVILSHHSFGFMHIYFRNKRQQQCSMEYTENRTMAGIIGILHIE